MNAMLKKLNNKRSGKKGFTLMEMLIVVAIIAILVAVAIPTFNGALDSARKNTDAANQRAAKAVAAVQFMTGEINAGETYNFDAVTGILTKNAISNTYGQCGEHKDSYLTAMVSTDGTVTIKWANSENMDLLQ